MLMIVRVNLAGTQGGDVDFANESNSANAQEEGSDGSQVNGY